MAFFRDDRHKDAYGFLPRGTGRDQPCFECGVITTGRHHVVPVSLGGTKQIPLCEDCHKKVHGTQLMGSSLIKAGLKRATARGVKLGAPIKITPKIREDVKLLRSHGFTIKKLANHFNLSVGTIHRCLSL